MTALEELLRFDAPSQLTVRTALEDVALGEHHIAEGEQVLVLVLRGAARRGAARPTTIPAGSPIPASWS